MITLLAIRGLTAYRLKAGSDDTVLDRRSTDPTGHLIIAGRYDGPLFAGDTCRLVVLPSVPAASTEFERLVMAYLRDATYMRHRVGQRVTQALGRANRRPGDWAMYIGLSPGYGQMLAQSGVQSAIPPDVKPDVDLAMQRRQGGWDASETTRTTSGPAPAPRLRHRSRQFALDPDDHERRRPRAARVPR